MCIWRILDAMSVVVMVWGSVGMLVVCKVCARYVCVVDMMGVVFFV